MSPGPNPGVTLIRKLALALAGSALLLIPAQATTAAAYAAQPVVVTVSAVAAAQPTALAVAPTAYRVQPHDTLSQISQRFCGSAGRYRNLAAASGIANYDLIYPGQVITLDCSHAVVAVVHAPAPARQVAHAAPAVDAAVATGRGATVAAFALSQVGKRYVWATAGPNTYDCSGLVVAAYARLGINLPHQSESLLGRGQVVSRSALQPGDVIWPEHGHVMIYIGGGKVVEAADPRQGVRINTVYAFMTARRF